MHKVNKNGKKSTCMALATFSDNIIMTAPFWWSIFFLSILTVKSKQLPGLCQKQGD